MENSSSVFLFFFFQKKKISNKHRSPKLNLNLDRVHYLIYKFLTRLNLIEFRRLKSLELRRFIIAFYPWHRGSWDYSRVRGAGTLWTASVKLPCNVTPLGWGWGAGGGRLVEQEGSEQEQKSRWCERDWACGIGYFLPPGLLLQYLV